MPFGQLSDQEKSAKNVGILAIEVYFPNLYVDQDTLEDFDGASKGKYTIGLGQQEMGFCDENEDIHSLCLTVVSNLMRKYGIDYNDIGRLEVGTETIIDKSKSVKSVLMQLFEESNNFNVEGADTTNACYGGTNALFNSISWVESSNWDGRFALVVCGDIAIYAKGNARCTGGAGAVAMLIGPDAPLVMEPGLRYSYVRHSYDFYKPDLASEYPVVDGKLTLASYIGALDECYKGYCRKSEKQLQMKENSFGLSNLDYVLFHCPYCKLVQKSLARLLLIDEFIKASTGDLDKGEPAHNLSISNLKDTIGDRVLEKQYVNLSANVFNDKTSPSLMLARRVGNMYTPSLYGCLVSLVHKTEVRDLHNKRIAMFSYGSGLIASMFSLRAVADNTSHFTLQRIKLHLSSLHERLTNRKCLPPNEFAAILERREAVYNKANYTVTPSKHPVCPHTYVLTQVDDMFRRKYEEIGVNDKVVTNGN